MLHDLQASSGRSQPFGKQSSSVSYMHLSLHGWETVLADGVECEPTHGTFSFAHAFAVKLKFGWLAPNQRNKYSNT